jgi:hypothetical protein
MGVSTPPLAVAIRPSIVGPINGIIMLDSIR